MATVSARLRALLSLLFLLSLAPIALAQPSFQTKAAGEQREPGLPAVPAEADDHLQHELKNSSAS